MLKAGFKPANKVPMRTDAIEPVFSLDRVITGRFARLLAALGGASVLLYLGMLVPGLFLLFLPLTVAAVGKVYDEARIIKFLRYGEPLRAGHWEEVETSTESIRIKAFDIRNAQGFSR